MKTPCRAACKNNGGICSGCHRTMDEIIGWAGLSESERGTVMRNLSGANSTHQCPQCGEHAQCDIRSGKETCWCFSLEKRETTSAPNAGVCLCRQCLSSLPIE
ncbi:cysteine-rich CWC family protein [Vibrio artabrorum]|uniref:Cysteine-rich CWC family protein n=1 Tax=Vibrio artabrorum TaxID=446374 RepID=A0ABT8CN29_9VIBR|nr:cysteine-rich CWC family protein [Vibrio artabrorum]MDN3701864.1 cysteine-rich CWC family protein [Vibrio artabrorum]